jgi:hypothetical protein
MSLYYVASYNAFVLKIYAMTSFMGSVYLLHYFKPSIQDQPFVKPSPNVYYPPFWTSSAMNRCHLASAPAYCTV